MPHLARLVVLTTRLPSTRGSQCEVVHRVALFLNHPWDPGAARRMHVKVAFRCGLHTVWGDAGALASRNLSTSAEGIPRGRPLSFSAGTFLAGAVFPGLQPSLWPSP